MATTLNFKKVNPLPMRTWNALRVNETSLSLDLPLIKPYEGEVLVGGQMPKGVRFSQEIAGLPAVQTGMGEEAVQFALENKNTGVVLEVQPGVRVSEPVFLNYIIDGSNPAVVDVNTIVAGEGSEVTVVMSYRSAAGFAGFHGGLTHLYAHKSAVIRLIQVQLLGDDCTHFDNVGALVDEDAAVEVVQAQLGAQTALAGCYAQLAGAGSCMDLDAIYFGDRGRTIDINYVAKHIGERSQADIRVNGALLDNSRKLLRATVDFESGAKHAVGRESEYTLLFSPKARSRTVPLILCGEEDVEGQHAATIGRMDESKLFYLMSRGLDELAAKKLVIEAQFQPVTQKIPDETLQSEISDYVKARLSRIEPLS